MKTKITKSLTIIALGALALTGCASPNTNVPNTDYNLTKSERVAVATDVLREEYPRQMRGQTEADVEELMDAFCEAVDHGLTLEDYIYMAQSEGVNLKFAAGVAGVSIGAICPENEHFLD